MKTSVSTQITIKKSNHKVFTYLTDLHYVHLWNPQLRKVSDKKILKLGSSYTSESEILGVKISAINVITKFHEGNELQIENETGTVAYIANFKLKSVSPDETTVMLSTTVSSSSKAFAFTLPVLKVLARRELQTDLQALKIAVEHELAV